MANDDDDRGGWTCLELNCSGRQLETAKATFTSKGLVYRVTCGPLSDDELVRLTRASQSDAVVRLVFPRSVITLSRITLECPKPGWAQLEGLVIGPSQVRGDGKSEGNSATT
jgi:hypothetical protein